MSDTTTVEVVTNTDPTSCKDVNSCCATMWSLAQQFCYMRLCNTTESKASRRVITYYAARARRIAATYARIYLEQEERSDPSKKGRHYWMALGAFASKTVACSLEDPRLFNRMTQTVRDGLGQGNFWLFQDIAAWHWHYNLNPESFDACAPERNAADYMPKVKEQLAKLPWSEDSLRKINNFGVAAEVIEAMDLAKKIEVTSKSSDRRNFQLKNLLAWATHEQRNILQKLIYENSDFAWWVQVQRGGKDADAWGRIVGVATSWMAPRLKIAFVSACDAESPEFKSAAPEDMKLEVFASRMSWIGIAARKFHNLMVKFPERMDEELHSIASWVGQPDAVRYPGESAAP